MSSFQEELLPVVSVVGGSTSDFPLLKKATLILKELGIQVYQID